MTEIEFVRVDSFPKELREGLVSLFKKRDELEKFRDGLYEKIGLINEQVYTIEDEIENYPKSLISDKHEFSCTCIGQSD